MWHWSPARPAGSGGDSSCPSRHGLTVIGTDVMEAGGKETVKIAEQLGERSSLSKPI